MTAGIKRYVPNLNNTQSATAQGNCDSTGGAGQFEASSGREPSASDGGSPLPKS